MKPHCIACLLTFCNQLGAYKSDLVGSLSLNETKEEVNSQNEKSSSPKLYILLEIHPIIFF